MSRITLDYRTKFFTLASLLGVLTLTAVLGWVFSQQAVAQRQADEPLLAGLASAGVTGLQVGTDLLVSKSDRWTLRYQDRPYPASADRVETYLKTLAGQKKERLVTRGSDAAAYGLDKDFKTLKILGAQAQVLFQIDVGHTNELGDKVYVRLAGHPEIWQTDRGFARTLDLDFNTWADLALFPGHKDGDLTRLTFDSRVETSDKTSYGPFDLVRTLTAGKGQWKDSLSKASTESMASWASLVPTVRASAFLAPQESADGAPVGRLVASWSDGTTTVVLFGSPDAQGRYPLTIGDAHYWLNDWALGQILYK